jgi:hypothetical protein
MGALEYNKDRIGSLEHFKLSACMHTYANTYYHSCTSINATGPSPPAQRRRTHAPAAYHVPRDSLHWMQLLVSFAQAMPTSINITTYSQAATVNVYH